MLLSLKNISNENLISKLKSLKDTENKTLANLILYLSEVDERKLYRDLGYSSLFSYCREGLGYSDSASYRRIQAARSLKSNPAIYESVKTGKITLCAIAEIAKIKENKDKEELLKAAEGKSRREVQILTAKYQAPSAPKPETIRAKTVVSSPDLFTMHAEVKESFTITIEVDKEFMELLTEAKKATGHVPTSEVFRKTLKEYVSKRNTIKRKVKIDGIKNNRFIPKATKLEILKRDSKQCTFIAPDGRRCTEEHGLEFDHIIPASAGGSREISNLRLVCRAHNQLHAEKFYGKEKMQKYQTQRI